ncbi:hypothetical protein ABT189_16875 [Streptomyces sp900105755]|uniref:hypothetical protein n=1 Tax=Streptomyces sp. 900105755 TaxID=3154389 RepID=UPI003322BD8E
MVRAAEKRGEEGSCRLLVRADLTGICCLCQWASDALLAELVRDRVRGIEERTTTLRAAAGTGTVEDNLADALQDLFGPVTVTIVALITFRDSLRARPREAGVIGIPLAVHLLSADRAGAPPQNVALHKMVTTVIVGSLRPPQS